MSKKVRVIIAVLLLAAVLGGVSIYRNILNKELSGLANDDQNVAEVDKHIQIIIEDNEKNVVYDEKVGTNAENLRNLLIEMDENEDIELAYEDGTYGMYITGLGADTLIEEDGVKKLFWTYSSENNEVCVSTQYCPAADSLTIEDGDIFVFSLSAY